MGAWFENNKDYGRKNNTYHQKKITNKSLIIVFIILICLSYVLAYDVFGAKTAIKNLDLEKFSPKIEPSLKKNLFECPEDIINDWFLLKQQGEYLYLKTTWTGHANYNWKDGQPLQVDRIYSPLCRKGFKEGEHIEYFYCENLYYYKQLIETNDKGFITRSEDINYKISLVVAPTLNDASQRVYAPVSSTCLRTSNKK